MNRFKINLLLLLSVSLLLGCATGQKSRKDLAREKYLKHQVSKTTRGHRPFNPANCPTSEKLWKDYSWKKLVEAGNACIVAERWARLELVGNHLATQHPLAPWGSYFLSIRAEKNKELDRALWMIDLALEKADELAILHYQKARVLWQKNQPEKAVQIAEKSLGIDPHLIDAHLFLGEIYLRDHMTRKAEDHFEYVLKNEPRNAIATAGMADLNSFERNNKEAIKYLRKLIRLESHVLNYRVKLARIYEREGQMRNALLTYETLRSLIKENEIEGHPKFNLDQKIKSLKITLDRKKNTNNQASLRKPLKERGVSQ